MPGGFVEHRLRVHDGNPATLAAFRAATGGALFTVTSVRADSLPYLVSAPSGDGASVDVFTGKVKAATYTGQLADAVTATSPSVLRVFSSQLEDAGGLQQLGNRYAAFDFRLNGGAWQVLTLGLLTRFTLSSNITWDITIDDPTKGENGHMAFAPQQDPATSQLETIAQYLARWPNRGCIFGGPVKGGFLNQPDRGGWEMTVNGRFGPAGGVNDVVQETFLDFHYGYAAPLFKRSTDAQACMAAAKDKTDSRFRRNPAARADGTLPAGFITTFDDAQGGQWGDVLVEIVGVGYCTPRAGLFYRDHSGKNTLADGDDVHLLHDIRYRGVYVHTPALGTGGMPADGSAVRVRAFTAQVSDISPIYWAGHPVDLLTKLWDEAGIGWNATAVANTKAAIGAQLYLALRITAAQEMGSFLENTIYGPFGIGVGTNNRGELAPFASRRFASAPPTATITNATVVRGSTKPFDLDVTTAVRKVTFEHDRLALPQRPNDASSIDGFLIQHEKFEWINTDAGALGTQEVNYSVPGMVGLVNADNSLVDNAQPYSQAIAVDVFSRAGRGMRVGATTIIRGADAALDALGLGDEVLVALKETPNHNQRLGDNVALAARAMQIVHRTVKATGFEIELADSGANAQPFATLPTLSLAASSDQPSNVALVTVTNAATLNAANVGARVQMAITTGSAPAPGDYTDVAHYAAGAIPTAAIRLPAVMPGATVWVQARSEAGAYRPSNYSTPIHLALTALAAPSALSAIPSASDGSQAALAWTPGTTDGGFDTDVYLRASGAPSSAAVRVISLASASVNYTLEHLTPGSAYTAGVQHRERATGIVSAVTEVTFTAGAVTVMLGMPLNPTGFSGSQDPTYGFPQQDGVYGLAVAATVFPGFTEFQEAVETAVGSGAYGAAVTVAKVANVQGDWTAFELVAPNDGLRRQLTARQVRDGATASAYTALAVVSPWTAQYLPRYSTIVQPTGIPHISESESSDGTTATIALGLGFSVDNVHVYYRTVPITTDPTQALDFNDGCVLPVDGTLILRAVNQAVSFSLPQPQRNNKLCARLVPWYLSPGGTYVAGESIPLTIGAAPPGVHVGMSVDKIGNLASLTVDLSVAASDVPGFFQIIETVSGVDTVLLSQAVTGNVNFTPAAYSVLANRVIPANAQSMSWRAVFTDVAGLAWPFGPVTVLSGVPSLTAEYQELTSTTGQIVWTCLAGVLSLSIDGVNVGTPPASPIPITLNNKTHNYAFVATIGDQSIPASVTVPAKPGAASSNVVMSALSLTVAQPTPINTLQLSFSITGTYDHWKVFWQRDSSAGAWNALANNTSTWTVGPPTDIANSHSGEFSHTFYAYVEAYDASGNLLGVSPTTSLTVQANADY